MTPEAQRIVIAEACGWPIHWVFPIKNGKYEAGDWGYSLTIPTGAIAYFEKDALTDLNAMYEAEGMLDWNEQASDQLFNYRCHLTKICGSDGDLIFHAKAAQRAEAFLKTIGKWDEKQ